MNGYGPSRARKLRKQAQRYLRSLGYKILGGTKMLGELKIIDEFADKFDFRMFGPALLEKEVSWPVDYNGNPMLFFIGLPANLLNKKLDINLYCNIFITYDHEDDQHIYDLSDKNPEPNKSSCVILSDIRSSKAKKVSCIEPSKKLSISESDDEVPYWLQDPIQKSNMSFQFQIYAGEIDNMFQQDFGDEFYYFFCNENCSEGNVFVQIT